MANEYRIVWLGAETLAVGAEADSGVRVFQVTAESLVQAASGDSAVRIAQAQVETLVTAPDSVGTVKVFGLLIEVLAEVTPATPEFAPSTIPEPSMSLDFQISFQDGIPAFSPISLGEPTVPGGFDTGYINLPPVYPDKFVIHDRERNPYAPHLPADQLKTDEYLKEQQRILRQQHNTTQAGDSTFDFGLLLKSTPKKLYTLGSLGRFYHDDHGIIIARYVQFKDMVATDYQGYPCGRLKFNVDKVDWLVTNNFDKSTPDNLEGMCFIADVPPDGYYGWMVTHGANPTSIGIVGYDVPDQASQYYWHSTGYLSLTAVGRPVGYRWGLVDSPSVGTGGLMINVGAFGLDRVLASISAAIQELQAAIDLGGDESGSLTERLDAAISAHAALELTVATLTSRLALEENMRQQQFISLQSQIGAAVDWAPAIVAESNLVRAEFAAADDLIRTALAEAKFIADSALAATQGIDFSSLSSQLTDTLNLVASVATAALEYHVPFGFNDAPTASEVLLRHTFARAVVFDPDFATLVGKVDTNPTATATLTFKQNATTLGTVSISTAGVISGSTSGAEVSFVAGDQLKVEGQVTPDATFANSSFTWKGTKI